MSVALLKFPLVAIFVRVACARTFLNTDQEMGEFMSQSAVRESLFAELKHAVAHGLRESKLLRLEGFLKPMFAALPKNELGKLGVEGVSYALHRFFVQRHGWHVKGLEPGARAEGVSPAASILKDRVPSYMESMVEEQLGGRPQASVYTNLPSWPLRWSIWFTMIPLGVCSRSSRRTT